METDIQTMVDQLTIEEQEVAARSSYRYFLASSSLAKDNDEKEDKEQDRVKAARKVAARHWIAEKGNTKRAFSRLQKTIKYRQEANIDSIRVCFDPNHPDYAQLSEYRLGLLPHLSSAKVFCRGHDRQNRTIYTVVPRYEMVHEGWTDQWFTPAYCAYSLERALACNELLLSSDDKVVAVFDYTGWQLRNAPPIPTTRRFLSTLQSHYPEQIHAVYLVNTPRVFRVFWRLVKPFVEIPVEFVTGPAECQKAFADTIDPDQAQPFMLPNGQQADPVDTDRYLAEIPFNQPY